MKSPRATTTLGDLHRATPWLWLYCERCRHSAPIACAVPVIRRGPDTSSDTLRQCARCTACGHKGATLQHPVGAVPISAFCRFPRTCSLKRADELPLLSACAGRHQFRHARGASRWLRSSLAACTKRPTPGTARPYELLVRSTFCTFCVLLPRRSGVRPRACGITVHPPATCRRGESRLGGIARTRLIDCRGFPLSATVCNNSCFEPSLRHLQEDAFLPITPRSFCPVQAFVRELPIFLRRHDAAPIRAMNCRISGELFQSRTAKIKRGITALALFLSGHFPSLPRGYCGRKVQWKAPASFRFSWPGLSQTDCGSRLFRQSSTTAK
jgi:hypothetical protein